MNSNVEQLVARLAAAEKEQLKLTGSLAEKEKRLKEVYGIECKSIEEYEAMLKKIEAEKITAENELSKIVEEIEPKLSEFENLIKQL